MLLSTGSNSKKSLPLIITLSSFDLYTSRPRQALLYVLLDAVQAGSYTPGLCVVGMTSRLDTNDLLEKRVRSRFGGRTINVWPEDVWVDVMRRTLLTGLCHDASPQGKDFDKAWKDEVEAVCSDKKVLSLLEGWKNISNVVRSLFKAVVSVALLTWLILVTQIIASPGCPFLSIQSWLQYQSMTQRFIQPFYNSNVYSPAYHLILYFQI